MAFIAANWLFAVPSFGDPNIREETVPLSAALADGDARPLGADGEDPAALGPSLAESAAARAAGPIRYEPGWGAEVDLPFDAPMVNLTWSGAPLGAVHFRSHGPDGWSDWVDLHADPNEGPDDAPQDRPSVVGPVWVGQGTTKVQVQLEDHALTDLAVTALDVNWPESRGVAGAAPATPGFVSRAAWGGSTARWVAENPGCETGPQNAPGLRRAIVHHTVNTNNYSQAEAASLILGIWRTHTGTNGWCDIGYNFVIDRFGTVYEGRINSIGTTVIGGHAAGWNTNSTGIALLGQHQPGASPGAASPSAATMAALQNLIVWKFERHGTDPGAWITEAAPDVANGRYPAGTPVTLPAILGHRDVNQTSCPGELTYQQLDSLRFAVWGITANSGPHHPRPTWTPNPAQDALQTVNLVGDVNPVGGAASLPTSGHWANWQVVRDAVGDASGGYVLDAFGGLHPFGDAAPTTSSGYWLGWDIARGAAPGPNERSGYVLDGWGAMHPFGDAPATFTNGYWPGWDIARDIATTPSNRTQGYVLDGFGGLHPFGGAPEVSTPAYWPGWDVARAVVLRPDGPGGWVLDGFGAMHPFGGAPSVAVSHYTGAVDHVDAVALPGNRGYVLDDDGRAWPFGSGFGYESVRTSPSGGYDRTWTGLNMSAALLGPTR